MENFADCSVTLPRTPCGLVVEVLHLLMLSTKSAKLTLNPTAI